MNSGTIVFAPPAAPAAADAGPRERVLAYYEAATADYGAWSRDFNMHFGYWRRGLDPFDREALLQELNLQVLQRMALPMGRAARVADLGCGTGATARAIVGCRGAVQVDAVTLSPTQVAMGQARNAAVPRGAAIRMHLADYASTPLPTGAYDAVCLVESACHADGPVKLAVLREAQRLLRPGGMLVMVDGMLRGPLPTVGLMDRVIGRLYRAWCRNWAVPEMARLDQLPGALAQCGFEPPRVEDWSWRIAPSVAHVPLLATRFAIVELWRAGGRLPPWRWRHIVASALTPLLGLLRRRFFYGAVIARKAADAAALSSPCPAPAGSSRA